MSKLKQGDDVTNKEIVDYWKTLPDNIGLFERINILRMIPYNKMKVIAPYEKIEEVIDFANEKCIFDIERTFLEGYVECIAYKHKGVFHRQGDKPTKIFKNGEKHWYKRGKLHRDNDLPAIISNDCQVWFKNSKRHRENDQPAIIWGEGTKEWYQNDKRHRENGPAIISDDLEEYWIKGKRIKTIEK